MDLCCEQIWPAGSTLCEGWGFKSGWHGCMQSPDHRERQGRSATNTCVCKCGAKPKARHLHVIQ